MNEWPTLTLGEVCRQGGGFVRTGPFGGQLHQSDYVDDEAGIPVVMPKDMTNGRIDLSTIALIDQATSARLAAHLVTEGDIILSRRGDVGRSAWVGKADLPALCGTGSIRIHPGSAGPLDHSYLRYFMRSRCAIDFLEGQAVGATMPNLNAGIVQSLPVIVPPIDRQRAAGAILGTIERLIEKNRRQIGLLEQMAQAIYREWFVKFRYPGHEHATFVDSPLGPIPSDWRAIATRDVVASYIGGGWGSETEDSTHSVRAAVIRGTDLPKSRIGDLSTVPQRFHKVSNAKSRLLNAGDIVMEVSGGSNDQPVGRAFLVSESTVRRLGPVLPASFCKRIVLKTQLVSPEAFYFDLLEIYESREITEFEVQSTGIKNFQFEAFLDKHYVPVPSPTLSEEFVSRVRPLFELCQDLGASISALSKIRDMLLPKLVTGQIDVSSLDLDALLEGVA